MNKPKPITAKDVKEYMELTEVGLIEARYNLRKQRLQDFIICAEDLDDIKVALQIILDEYL